MDIAKDRVVCFHYTLQDTDGHALENSHDGEPQVYLHGADNLLPMLENAMTGHSEGDRFTVALDAIDAYGVRRDDLIQRIATKHLRSRQRKLAPGSIAYIETREGPRPVTVLKVGRHQATVDANHPLAGRDLVFDIEITTVREATADELAHGHAHGADGHAAH